MVRLRGQGSLDGWAGVELVLRNSEGVTVRAIVSHEGAREFGAAIVSAADQAKAAMPTEVSE